MYTFFDEFYGFDKVVDKVLEVSDRVCDTCSAVDLSKWGVEDGDNVFKQL